MKLFLNACFISTGFCVAFNMLRIRSQIHKKIIFSHISYNMLQLNIFHEIKNFIHNLQKIFQQSNLESIPAQLQLIGSTIISSL
jgi:hypothetical protein